MKLRSKLLLAQVPLVLALLVVGFAGSTITTSLGRDAQRILKDNYRSVLAGERMKESLERMDSGAVFSVAGERARGRAQAEEHLLKFEEELKVQEGNITEPGERDATETLRRHWQAYRAGLEHLLTQGEPPTRDDYFTRLLPAFERTKAATEVILAINQDAMVRKSEEAGRTARRFDSLLLSIIAAGCLLGLVASSTLTSRLLRPLGVLGQTARRIGEGDLVARAVVTGKDEIAQLSRELNTMADHLQQYRKSTLGELLEAQQASQAAIDSLPDPVLVLATDGALLHLNVAAEALLKVSLDAGGANALAQLDPVAREVVERVRQHVVKGKGSYVPKGLEEAFRLATADGERHLLPRASPVYAEGGAIVGTTVVLQDVTRLRRFDELKNDLVATVAHEFRTPLTSLQMAIHLCAEQVVGPLTDKQAELLFAAREDCGRLQGMVEELLDLSRIQAGRVELHREPMELESLVKKSLETHAGVAAQRQVSLRAEVLPDSGSVDVDPERLQLVFANLLGNAIRHSPEGAAVVVRGAIADGAARFEVVDEGPGIAKEYQQAIFEKFFRVPGSPTGSAGLGLFIAKELVQAHGGAIGVTSEPGTGSTFWFTLPLHAPPPRPTAP